MKKAIIYCTVLLVALVATVTLTACEDIEEVPPMKDSSTGKAYKIPDPVAMDAGDFAEYNAIRAEYESSTSK